MKLFITATWIAAYQLDATNMNFKAKRPFEMATAAVLY